MENNENTTTNVEASEKMPFGKLLIVAFVVTAVVILLAILAGKLGVSAAPEMCFIGILVWAKIFNHSLNPLDILKVWTGALVGILMCVATMLLGAKFGAGAGAIALLVLIYVQILFDVGKLCEWVVNGATPFFLTI